MCPKFVTSPCTHLLCVYYFRTEQELFRLAVLRVSKLALLVDNLWSTIVDMSIRLLGRPASLCKVRARARVGRCYRGSSLLPLKLISYEHNIISSLANS